MEMRTDGIDVASLGPPGGVFQLDKAKKICRAKRKFLLLLSQWQTMVCVMV